MAYDDYTVEDFVLDPDFQQWVRYPSAASDAHWEQWLTKHPARAAQVAEARQIIQSIEFTDDLRDEDIRHEWKKLQPLLTAPISEPEVPVHRIGRNWWQYGRYAAVLLAVLVSVAGYYLWRQSATSDMIQVATAYGQTRLVQLPDGSTVVLNANSTLTYPDDLDEQNIRRVSLNGEAYFSVVHTRTDQKFIVDADNQFNVEVLGTEFTVTRRKDHAKVVLTSGKVQLQTASQQVVMQPGEMVEMEPTSEQLTKKQVNPEVYSSWKDNQLIFENTTLAEIARLLAENYGLKVNILDTDLARKEFNGTFPSDNVEVLLKALERTYQLQIQRKDNQLLIRSQREIP